jgi:hypothetical protein
MVLWKGKIGPCEMAWTMLDEHRTPRRFWAEAMNTAWYVSNRIYLRVHKKKNATS